MIISVNWGNALIITLLGFGLVFVLLVLLVGVVSLFGKMMSCSCLCSCKNKNTDAQSSNKKSESSIKIVDGSLTEGEMAAVALAMHLCNGGAHIDDGHKLTIKRNGVSAWNSKQFGMNCL